MTVSGTANQAKPIEDEAFWKKHVERYQVSQLSRAAYCRLNQVNYDNFGYWLNKQLKKGTAFVAVGLKKEALPTLCSIVLKTGQRLQIHDQGIIFLIMEKLG